MVANAKYNTSKMNITEYKKLINTEHLGSMKRLVLIANYGNPIASAAASRCIEKRINRAFK